MAALDSASIEFEIINCKTIEHEEDSQRFIEVGVLVLVFESVVDSMFYKAVRYDNLDGLLYQFAATKKAPIGFGFVFGDSSVLLLRFIDRM